MIIKHPKHLINFIGAESDEVLPIHTVGRTLVELVLVYEPRRKCEYWIKSSDAYPPSRKGW